MQVSVHTDIGRQRSSNQDYADYFISSAGQMLFVLCDGVGGSKGGDVASQQTVEYLGRALEALEGSLSLEEAQEWLYRQVELVNKAIYSQAQSQDQLQGMSTTLVAAMVVEGTIIIAHVGDSRAYVYGQGHLRQVTEDHSLVNALIKTGELTKEEGESHPRRNVVTQSIGGTTYIDLELSLVKTDHVDLLMLCSDGLTNMVPQDRLLELIDQHADRLDLGDLLVAAANEAGGADNISIVIVRLDQEEEVENND